ncbi:hypothetical protein TMatcc_003038 [Talaromyces marneffei ATCC 18224]
MVDGHSVICTISHSDIARQGVKDGGVAFLEPKTMHGGTRFCQHILMGSPVDGEEAASRSPVSVDRDVDNNPRVGGSFD